MFYLTVVDNNCKRVAELGEWPAWIPPESLVERVPQSSEKREGFDAGIACALDLIPRGKQKLSATLHANYTPEAVAQIRLEIAQLRWVVDCSLSCSTKTLMRALDSETCWWLLACSLCNEEGMDSVEFKRTIEDFVELLADDPMSRVLRAVREADKMSESFDLPGTEHECITNRFGNVAVALRDGGMQGAYIHGHDLAIQYMHRIWFVGTYFPSLGLPEDFKWGTETDPESGQPTSGPVHGSKQFVKAANMDELMRVLEAVDPALLSRK